MNLHRLQHDVAVSLYFAENEQFSLDASEFNNPVHVVGSYGARVVRAANAGLYNKFIDWTAIDPESVVGIGSESVVVLEEDQETVAKYMFRYNQDPERAVEVAEELYETTREYVGDIALSTTFDVEEIKFFKLGGAVDVVTMRQQYLRPDDFQDLYRSEYFHSGHWPRRMIDDLQSLVDGWHKMKQATQMHPDLSTTVSNLFHSTQGIVKLVDVIPMPVSGKNHIGQDPPRRTQLSSVELIQTKVDAARAA